MKTVKKLIALSTMMMVIAPQVMASTTTLDNKWSQSLTTAFGKGNKLSQAYCYINDDGEVAGNNFNKLISIASVSKVFTTLWALDRLGKDFSYKTKIFIKDKTAHIQGGFDPVMGSAKLFWIIAELNKAGITQIDKLTFDRNLYVLPAIIDKPTLEVYYTDADGVNHNKFYTSTPKDTKAYLSHYFSNTSSWSAPIKADFKVKDAQFNAIATKINLKVKSIEESSENPFVKNGKYMAGVKIISFKSVSLTKIVKLMNSDSNNGMADLIFQGLGGKESFATYFNLKLGVDETQVQFQSGSGLPYTKSKDAKLISRSKNLATCQSVLKVLDLIAGYTNETLPKNFNGFTLPDLTCSDHIALDYMAVGGVEGTVKGRFAQAATLKSLVAKTGTLSDASALAGTISSTTGKRHFAVLNEIKSYGISSAAKKVQNTMVLSLIKEFSGGSKFSYTRQNHTYKTNFFGVELSSAATTKTN